MQNQFDETTQQGESGANEGEYAYKSVVKKDMKNRRTISVISLAVAVLSVLLFAISAAIFFRSPTSGTR